MQSEISREPRPPDDADKDRMIAWLRAARRPHAWQGLLPEMTGAIAAVGLDRPLASDIWRQVGGKWAAGHPLPACGTLEDAEQAMNAILASAVLGFTALIPSERSITILHSEPPAEEGAAADAMVWLFEGLYTAWMHELGANPALVARRRGNARPGQLSFTFAQAEAVPVET